MRILNRVINPVMNSFQNGSASQYFALKGDNEDRDGPYTTHRSRASGAPRLVWFMAISSFLSLLGIGFLLARPSPGPLTSRPAPPSPGGSTLQKWGLHRIGKPTKHLVIAGYKAQDIRWMSRMKTDETLKDWDVYRYVLDDPHPADGGLATPNSNGRETMAYLTYIIENYDAIADYVLFIHGHERAWHQPEPITMKIRNVNFTALEDHQLFNLRCPDRPGCGGFEQPLNTIDTQPDRQEWKPLQELWKTIFPQGDWMQDDGALPAWVMNTCCGQFAVAKEAILRRSREEWIRIREPLVKGSNAYSWGNNYNDYMLGLLYEKLWHLFFGKGAIFCHSADFCRDVQFGGKIKCDRWPEGGFPQLNEEFMQVHCWDDVEDSNNLTY